MTLTFWRPQPDDTAVVQPLELTHALVGTWKVLLTDGTLLHINFGNGRLHIHQDRDSVQVGYRTEIETCRVGQPFEATATALGWDESDDRPLPLPRAVVEHIWWDYFPGR